MMDCKYFLPCGRCEKKGALCDCNAIPIESPKCEHEWHVVGSVTGTKSRYEVFICPKCGQQETRKTIFNRKNGTYKVVILDEDNT